MIEKSINEALVKRDSAAKALLTILFDLDKKIKFESAVVYHQFPIYLNSEKESAIAADVVFVSKDHGIFIFQTVECSNTSTPELSNYFSKLGEVDRILFARILKESSTLQVKRRTLKIEITPVLFLNNYSGKVEESADFEIISKISQLEHLILSGYKKDAITLNEFKDLKATIEGSKNIPKIIERDLKDKSDFQNSKGAILSAIENEIYNFDLEQKRAALFILDGAQRIRGLAGSGKTVILAMKAALIHLQFPEANILYTYYTKSLNEIVKSLITRFYRQFAEVDPNWNKIHIMHAWGGRAIEGVYYNACRANNIPSIDLTSAKYARPHDPFDYVCEELDKSELKKQYDYSLIDEAQDFPQNFYRICRKLTERNRLVWAYDDFQNILETDIQDEKKTFGKNPQGEYYIDFSKRGDELHDLILHKCYRNPRKILISAFSLGLGIYNSNTKKKYQMIQRLENNEHWESLGFVVKEGNSEDGSEMIIERPEDNSLQKKNELLGSDDILKIYKAEKFVEELEFIVNSIIEEISKELRPEDITVVCMDTINVKKYFDYIEAALNNKGIKTFNLLNVPTTNKFFKMKDHVTLSTIFRAKGNESGSIFIAGIDSVFSEKNDITERNKIFTAMTRSLGWVTLSGVGATVDYCIEEIEALRKNNYELRFIQPSETEVKTIRQGINAKQKLLNKIERMADELVEETGISKDELVDQLKMKLLKKK